MIKTLGSCAAVSVLLLSGVDASAATLRGRLQYTRNWVNCVNGSRAACTDNGTARPLGPMVISALPATGAVVNGSTNANGDFSLTVPGGTTYQLRVHNRDGSLSATGEVFGTANVAITTSLTPPMPEIVDNVGAPVFVAVGATVTADSILPAGAPTDRANNYMAAQLFWDIWRNQYATLLRFMPFRIRVRQSGSFVGGAACNGNDTQNCYVRVDADIAARNVTTLWHEMGHGMQQLVQFDLIGDVLASNNTVCAGTGNQNASTAFLEGWADFVSLLTLYSPTTVPSIPNGVICTSCRFSPISNQPFPPACGVGAIPRFRQGVAKALVDLVDANTVPNADGCRNEQVAVAPAIALAALANYSFTTKTPGCTSSGHEEGGVREAASCAASTPNWPYQGPNALPAQDQGGSFLDYLANLKADQGVSGAGLLDIWANSCWQPGDSNVQLP